MIRHRSKSSFPARVTGWAIVFLIAAAGSFAARTTRQNIVAPDDLLAGIIIPNVDDDDGDGRPDFQADVPDAADNDLFRFKIVLPSPASGEIRFRVEIPEPWDKLIRLFLSDPSSGALRPFSGPAAVPAPADLAGREIALALEAADFAGPGRPPAFDLKVRFETKDGRPLGEQTFRFAVAPFLMSCCLDPAEAVQVVRTAITGEFVKALAPAVEAAGSRLEVIDDAAVPSHDIWIQDAVEIGSASDGQRLMHVALHGNRGRKLDDLFARKFLGRDSGVVHPGSFRGESAEWIDWFGNLEVSPPLRANGRDYPRGRIYAGTQGVRAMHPEVIKFLDAQGVQAPVLWLDTSWLVIGHVDETVSWVPSNVGNPFRMLIPSTRLAVEILRKAEKDAPGCVINRGRQRPGDIPGMFEKPVAGVLADKKLMDQQDFVQKKIDAVRKTLQDELGIADQDIIEIPVLFDSYDAKFAGRFEALTPNMVNSLLVGKTFIVPDPFGPLVDGRDVLLQAVKDRLEPIGCAVTAVDNFFPYHRWAGEVHCGTNATRNPATSH